MTPAMQDSQQDDLATSMHRKPPPAPGAQVRLVKAGECLYRTGEPKLVAYRVVKGAFALLERPADKPGQIIELAIRGEYLGLGCLATHTRDARAVVDSSVLPLTRSELAAAEEHDPVLKLRQSEEIDRELEQLKSDLSDRTRSTPTERIAAFLVAVSRQNQHEGRDPRIISDSLKCGPVSDLLGVDIDVLENGLRELQALGLVAPREGAGLLLRDLEALEIFSEGGCTDPGFAGREHAPLLAGE